MPAKPRSAVFDAFDVGVYHCWNRLVRRRHLFGQDVLTGRDYSYRKTWVRDRLRELAGSMAIDVLDYAILDNHIHVVLRNRPDIVATWSDEEVVRRWWLVCPRRRNADGSIPDPLPCELQSLLVKVADYRRRLSDISWFMRLACQPIARRANQEDDVDGRFFAKRFECRRLMSEADVLNCSVYIDLNWIRASMAETPESSLFTSAFDRILGRWQLVRAELCGSTDPWPDKMADDWLAPVPLDARSIAYVGPSSEASSQSGAIADAGVASPVSGDPPQLTGIATGSGTQSSSDDVEQHAFCNPRGSARISNKGFLPLTFDDYLTLLDTVGRVIKNGKRRSIPCHLPPILQRLGLEVNAWLESFLSHFHSDPYSLPCPLVMAKR